MTLTQSIITDAQVLLQDDGTRWPAAGLLGYLNDGQREIATQRPDMFAVTLAFPILGVKHTLPSDCNALVEIPRNTSGAPIRPVARAMLDAVEPSWVTKSASKVIKHTCYDLREPDVFYSYPPAATGASVDLVYSALPADALIAGNINVPDIFKNALLHFVMFRAHSKDAEFAGNAALAQANFTLFTAGLKSDTPVTPI